MEIWYVIAAVATFRRPGAEVKLLTAVMSLYFARGLTVRARICTTSVNMLRLG